MAARELSVEERRIRWLLIGAFALCAFAGVLGADVVELVRQPLRIGIHLPCWLPVPPWLPDFGVRVAFGIVAIRAADRRGGPKQWLAAWKHIARNHVLAGWATAHALGACVRVFEGGQCG